MLAVSKINKKEKIVVGMTGRMDSVVAAFLLKKQGYDCIGVAIRFLPDKAFEFENDDEVEEVLLSSHCNVVDLEAVQKICDYLEIPFYAIDAVKEFNRDVLSHGVGQRLSGRGFSGCNSCHKLVLEMLHSKLKALKADRIATGHFAKISKNLKTEEASIFCSLKLEEDQSHLLGGVEQNILRDLVLPLAEITNKEVQKISNLISKDISLISLEGDECFLEGDEFRRYVEYTTPESLRVEGSLSRLKDDSHIADHEGIHHYFLGQEKIPDPSGSGSLNSSWSVLQIDPATGGVFVGNLELNRSQKCLLSNFSISAGVDCSSSYLVKIKIGDSSELVEGTLYFKNNKNVVIDYSESQINIFKGLSLAIYTETSSTMKLIGIGVVEEIGEIPILERVFYSDQEDEDKSLLKVKKTYDYYF